MNMFEACRNGDHARVAALLVAGADINVANPSGNMPLHVAIMSGALDIVTLLITAGADINAHTQYGNMSPLHIAISHGHAEITTYLLAHGANVNAEDQHDDTPLHYAAGSHAATIIIRQLLAAGANVNAKNGTGHTPLHHCTTNQETIALLLAGQDTPGSDAGPDTFGLVTPGSGTTGADINEQTSNGNTLLHYIVGYNDIDIARYLLDAGARTDIRNADGITPLTLSRDEAMTTVLRDHIELITIKNATRRK